MNIGMQIKVARTIKKMTISELSEKTSISTSTIRKVERWDKDGANISVKNLVKMCNALGSTISFEITDL